MLSIKCNECGSLPKLNGSDCLNTEGPWYVTCTGCGKESLIWAYKSEAWKQWKVDNAASEILLHKESTLSTL